MSSSNSFFRKLLSVPVLGRGGMMLYRLGIASKYLARPASEVLPWVVRSREYTNFTYSLDDLNLKYLAWFVSDVASCSFEQARDYVAEALEDEDLHRHVTEVTLQHEERKFSDPVAHFGKRVGWYAIARATKPKVIVETGVEKGLGSVILASAILRNRAEGHPGKFYGTDIQPRAGYLLQGKYAEAGEILYGDSIGSLEAFQEKIDLFINDSDHSADYEAREYAAISDKLSERAVVIGDNAHVTDKLHQFALETGRRFLFFRETPIDHWYPGGGIGVAIKP